MMRKLTWILAGVLAMGLIAAGCGDDDDESSDTGTDSTEALSKSEFLAQGNQICAEGNRELDAAGQKAFGDVPKGEEPPAGEVEAFATDTLIPNVQGQIDDIRALSPPEGDADAVEAILDAAQADLDKIQNDPSLLSSEEDTFADANKLAKDYGLTECAGG